MLGRRTYTTPTSYLELINAFKTLITQKQESTMKAKRRYVVGLEKLAFAASQVGRGHRVQSGGLRQSQWIKTIDNKAEQNIYCKTN